MENAKKLNQIKVHAENGVHGLDIYLDVHGVKHYLTTRRRNGLLWVYLKDGVTIGELKRFKPDYTYMQQKIFHYSQYLIRVMNDYLKYEFIS
ncbi:hypothetical protein AGMMS49975_08190 [Clostridia bacterium]|nr:hypothetical protein AGMMS49975_08190 [Clostridia bacterium]